MEKESTRFVEQDAPTKNTDKAFVKVGEDGKPQLPHNDEEEEAPMDEEDAEKES